MICKPVAFMLLAAVILAGAACTHRSARTVSEAVVDAEQPKRPLPAGTVLRVRLYHAIETSRAQIGDSFIGSLMAPVSSDDKTVLPKGTVVRGIIQKVSQDGSTTLTLDRLDWNGEEVGLNTNSVTWTSADHDKRDVEWVGNTSVAGAMIGPDAGTRPGPTIPAESVLTFRLTQPVGI